LDPLWAAGRVTGYVTAILRTTPDAHPGEASILGGLTLPSRASRQAAAMASAGRCAHAWHLEALHRLTLAACCALWPCVLLRYASLLAR
jgi:hypothetical protein